MSTHIVDRLQRMLRIVPRVAEGSYGAIEESAAARLCRHVPRARNRGRGIGAWQQLIRLVVQSSPGIRLVNGVPLVLIAGVVAIAIVVDLLGGVIFDFDVRTVYRGVFRKLDRMVAEMEELRR
jgi:hypothetical protein